MHHTNFYLQPMDFSVGLIKLASFVRVTMKMYNTSVPSHRHSKNLRTCFTPICI